MGYTVFAGCYNCQHSKELFESRSNIIPLQLDVTKDNEVQEYAALVNKWLDETNTQGVGRKRILHALINNSGIVTHGEALQEYQNMMDGMYFCLFAFLLIILY